MKLTTRVYNSLNYRFWNFMKFHLPFLYVKHRFFMEIGKKINLSNPRDLNEKIIWLEHFSDITLWTTLADKYRVRKYVTRKIGEDILIPLIGKWENADDIDFNSLPQKFVIKPNNGSYDTIIVTDKSKTDTGKIRQLLNRSLQSKFGYDNGEIHYLRIKPCIIAEKLLETNDKLGLVDYKFWCFDGKPYCIFVCVGRNPTTHHAEFTCYDLDWNWSPGMMHPDFRSPQQCPEPKNLSRMIEIASKLSEGLPQCRVDLYNVEGHIYFGEMTLTSNYGMMPYFSQATLNEMGQLCILPKRSITQKMKYFINRYSPKF